MIAMATLDTPNIRLYADFTADKKERYCSKHGYDWYRYEVLDPSRSPSWNKILVLQNLLKWYEWVFWTDADSIITNESTRIEDFCDDDYDMIWCKDVCQKAANCGQMLVRSTDITTNFLSLVWEQTDFLNHIWWEQAAIRHVLGKGFPLNHKLLPSRDFNSFAPEVHGVTDEIRWQEGDFICHFPGLGTYARTILVRKYEILSQR